MPPRSKVDRLPDDVREELNRRLIANGFAEYEDLASWLQSKGFEISKSSLGRYGLDFKQRVETLRLATEQARVIVAETPDDEGAMNEALLRLTQEKLFQAIMNLDEDAIEGIDLSKMARAIADLGRASIAQKRYESEVRRRVAEAAASVEEIARGGGASDDMIGMMKREVLEIIS